MAAEIVDLADPSLLQDRQYASATVLHVEPVADVDPLPMHREGLIVMGFVDHEWDGLLGELVRAAAAAETEMVAFRRRMPPRKTKEPHF